MVKESVQAILAILVSFFLAFVWTFFSYFSGLIIAIGKPFERYGFELVKPGGIDGAAVISTGLYLFVMILISVIYYKLLHFRVFAITLLFASLIFSFLVFGMFSSLLWF
ncbi:hypothetical protein BC351_15410 [Paenibacillus ferrarius]|uniref:Uncharacterized protein n=1 Tax=Paenibacillus ferrarius TaxID=1469647 RepID=A0A1V4HS03_9BACL|nr:hypothetical protein BC351_15410 [Paenibacillus ferrarius]